MNRSGRIADLALPIMSREHGALRERVVFERRRALFPAEAMPKQRVEVYCLTDKARSYAAAIAELKKEGKCPKETEHREVK